MNDPEFQQTANSLKDKSLSALETVQAKAGDCVRQTNDTVRKNPAATLAIAILAGAVIGALLSRPRRPEPVGETLREWLASCPVGLDDVKQSISKLPAHGADLGSELGEKARVAVEKFRFW